MINFQSVNCTRSVASPPFLSNSGNKMKMISKKDHFSIITIALCVFCVPSTIEGFVLSMPSTRHLPTARSATVDEETPAGIGGAQFFGGNKQKEEFYDDTAEQAVTELIQTQISINRFQNRLAFENDQVAAIASSLQSQINKILYNSQSQSQIFNTDYTYGKVDWISPLPNVQCRLPLDELQRALSFYKHVDLAIVSGQQASDSVVELQWELSVAWPTFWEPRAVVLGSSTLTFQGTQIVSQLDKVVDNGDLLATIGSQIVPRFWDFYHIGMTPCAEIQPKFNRKEPSLFGNYQVYDIPARWVVQPTVLETGTREDFNAQFVPNHAFSCLIKTMGPTRQRYVPTSPVQVQIIQKEDQLQLLWKIPLSVEFQATTDWPLADSDEEAVVGSEPECQYVYEPRRRVATVPYGGDAQDKEISQIRKQLYEQVLKDGFQPRLENGRPIFFFLTSTVKACYTTEGLGMCVYEWRPKWAKANEVGIELDLQESALLPTTKATSRLVNGSN